MGLVRGCKCLHDGETDFVDCVGEVVDLVGVVVVGDNSESTGSNTEGGVDKSFRDTGREFGGVRSAGLSQSLEGFDHTHYSTEQTNEGTESGEGSHDGEGLLEGRHFQSGCFFNGFLEVGDFLFFGQNGVGVHFFVGNEGSSNNSSHRTFLFSAEFLSFFDVVLHQSGFNFGHESGDGAGTFGSAESESAFNGDNDYGEEEGLKDRHDEAAFVDGAPEVNGVAVFEVNVGAEPEDEQKNADNCSCEDYPRCIFDTGGVAFSFGCFGSSFYGGLLSFHN